MTLDEAIQHCEEVAIREKSAADGCRYWTDGMGEETAKKCEKCAEEHHQLAEWLKELKAYREHGGDAISRQEALNAITMAEVRWQAVDNVNKLPSVTPQQRTGRWIPVWERVPEERGVYLVTQKAIFSGHVFRRIVGYAPNLHDVDEYDFADKKRPGWYEYDSEWGYRELDDVIAWMPLVEPYKVESEEV